MNIEPKAMAGDIPVYCSHDEIVDIMKVIPNPKNPNMHPDRQIEILSQVIKAQGWRKPITVSKRSGFVVSGHGRLQAALILKLDKVPVDYQDYSTEAEEYADLVADNRIAELSEINDELLHSLLEEIKEFEDFNFELTGYTDFDIDSILEDVDGLDFGEDTEAVEDDYEVELPDEPKAKPGDIYKLGNHRLMCGNSFEQNDIDSLLDGNKCELTFTDPPYQLDTQGGGLLKKANSMKQIKENGVDRFDPSNLILQSDTNIYCHNKPLIKKYIELAEENKKPYDLCFYKKIGTVPNYKGHLMTDCEYIAVIGKQDPNQGLQKETYSKCYIGKKDSDNDLSYSKPVELCAKYIKLYAKNNVLDLFGGSGSTLIACEQLNKNCYIMEIDPKYVDVIIDRWEKFTGKKAELFERDSVA